MDCPVAETWPLTVVGNAAAGEEGEKVSGGAVLLAEVGQDEPATGDVLDPR